jgi:hypothetical protein
MKKLFYDEGPLLMSCGAAGIFRINEPRDLDDSLAEVLIKKGRLKEWPGEPAKITKGREKEE